METEDKLLSVVVPVFNVKDYIDGCIKSIISSIYNNIEVILVDDGSTDGSGEKCDWYAHEDNRIKVIHKKNGGLVSARKAGVELAKGEYLTFVDGDDYIEEDFYNNAMQLFKNDVDYVCLGMTWKSETSEAFGNDINEGIYRAVSNNYIDPNGMKLLFMHNAVNKIYKTELIKKTISNVDDKVYKAEDLNLTLAYIRQCKSFCVSNSVCGYNYVMRDTSISHKYDADSIDHMAEYLKSSMRLIEDSSSDETDLWNKHIFNVGFNLIMSDCIGCTLKHYGKSGLLSILKYFKRLTKNPVLHEFYMDGVDKEYFSENRKIFAEYMCNGNYFKAFIFRVLKKVR